MAILSKGTTFSTGDQVTATNLNALVDSATFATGAVDDSTTALDSSTPKKIIVKNAGITSTQLATDSVTTVKVENNAITLAKMATQADQTVLGNVSGGAAVPTAVPIVGAAGILINNDSLGTDDTKGATQGNIKAYVDASSTDGFTPTASASDTKSVTLPNGLIMKFGRVVASGSTTTTINFSDFGGNFTNDIFSVVLTPERSGGETNGTRLNAAPSTSSFVIRNHLSGNTDVDFIAIGR
tara:strand:+ start:163 stop:882 length:720 start_codon:yes stop_codon:yes gene_type:complete